MHYSNLGYSSIFWGILALIITFAPFFLYIKYLLFKKQDSNQQLSFFEIIIKVFIIQIILASLFYLLALTFQYLIKPNSSYLPCVGLRTFFLAESNAECGSNITKNIEFYRAWDNFSSKQLPSAFNPVESANVAIGKLMFFISQFYYFFVFALFLSIIIIPSIRLIRKIVSNNSFGQQSSDTVMSLVFTAIIESVIMYFLIIFHLSLGSSIIESIAHINNFSFYKEVISIFRDIFGVNNK